jgi:hypothetical protein
MSKVCYRLVNQFEGNALRSPGIRRFHGAPLMWNKCGFTDAAQSLIKTSWSLGVGFATSVNCSTSAGPYRVRTIAFIEAREKNDPPSRKPQGWASGALLIVAANYRCESEGGEKKIGGGKKVIRDPYFWPEPHG